MEKLIVPDAVATRFGIAAPRSAPAPARPAESAELTYGNRLRTASKGVDEAALTDAHEFGRERLREGHGVVDTVALHNRLLVRLLGTTPPGDAATWVESAGRLLVESLTPFEMTHRGFREAHHELQVSEERYRDLIENANDVIFTADLNGHITSLNRAGELLTGYTREEMTSMHVDSILAPQQVRPSRRGRQLRMGHLPGRRTFYDVDIVARDGRRIPLEVSIRRLYEDNRAVGIQGIARDVTDRKQAESALRHVNRHLEDKAKRIAHALHDEAGQLLASVYLRVAEIADALPPEGRRQLDDLRTLLDQVDDQVRRLAHELRPTVLDDLGLIPACQFVAEGVSKRAHVQIEVGGTTGGRLPADVETALYRVVQEALNNAARHAEAKMISIFFNRVGPRLSGRIRDNGVGFDVPHVMNRTEQRGLGLMGMRERLSAVGGRLTILSEPGRGTTLDFEVSLET